LIFRALRSGATIPFELFYLTSTATNLINYANLELLLRPPGYCDSTWNTIWSAFQAQVGPTWGGLVTFVDAYATAMSLTNAPGHFYLFTDVLNYAFGSLAGGGCTGPGSLYPPGVPGAPPGSGNGPGRNVPSASSADPNAKFATGVGASQWVAAGDPITYTVEFANETNASAPAQTVSITDPLAANLNWSTLQLTTIGFNNVTISLPRVCSPSPPM